MSVACMSKRERMRYALAIAGSMALSVIFLQAEHGAGTRKFLKAAAEFLIKVCLGLVGFLVASMGGWGMAPESLLFVMAVDYLTGLAVASFGKSQKTKSGGLSSAVGFKGLTKKGIIMLVVVLAYQVDKSVGNGLTTWRDVTCYCYIGNELLSIIENLGLLGIWIPAPLVKMLEVMRNKGIILKAPGDMDTSNDANDTKGTGLG